MRARSWIIIGVLVAVASAVGVGAWYYFKRPAPPTPPAVPDHVTDSVVREVLEGARQQVVADPRSAAAWGEYGLLLRAHRLGAESNFCFTEAARLDPKDPRWPYLIGLGKLLDKPRDAIPYLRTAYAVASTADYRSAARLRLAEALLTEGNDAEAAALFEEEVQHSRDSPRARYGLAVVAANRGDPQAVIRYLEPLATHPMLRQKAAAMLGPAHQQLGNRDAAARYAAEIARPPADIPPSDPFVAEYMNREVGRQSKLQQVTNLQTERRFGDAVIILEELAQSYPTDDHIQLTFSIFLAEIGQNERAVQTARTAIALNPDHPAHHYYLGSFLCRSAEQLVAAGRATEARPLFEEALREFNWACELKPDYGQARMYAGLCLRDLGRGPEAIAAFREAVRLSPQYAELHFRLGEALFDSGDPQAAIPPLNEALRIAPEYEQAAVLLKKAQATARK